MQVARASSEEADAHPTEGAGAAATRVGIGLQTTRVNEAVSAKRAAKESHRRNGPALLAHLAQEAETALAIVPRPHPENVEIPHPEGPTKAPKAQEETGETAAKASIHIEGV